jgi:hypothetical protein
MPNCSAFVVAFALLVAACNCPTNQSGVATSGYKYTAERDVACAALSSCDREFLDSVPVYESEDPGRDCQDTDDIGCFCEAVGCVTIILPSCSAFDEKCEKLQRATAIHEYVHAAYASIGVDTRDHPASFKETLKLAKQTYAKAAE